MRLLFAQTIGCFLLVDCCACPALSVWPKSRYKPFQSLVHIHTSARKSLHTNTTLSLVGRTDRISSRMRLPCAFTFIRIVFAFHRSLHRTVWQIALVAVVLVVVSSTFPFPF